MSCLFLLQSCELTHVTLGFSHYLSSACRKNIIYKIIKIPNAKLYFSLCKYWDFGYHEGEISISVKGSNISITIVKGAFNNYVDRILPFLDTRYNEAALVTLLTALPPNWVPQWYHGTGSSDIWDPAGSDIRYHPGPFQSDEMIEFDSMSSQTKS